MIDAWPATRFRFLLEVFGGQLALVVSFRFAVVPRQYAQYTSVLKVFSVPRALVRPYRWGPVGPFICVLIGRSPRALVGLFAWAIVGPSSWACVCALPLGPPWVLPLGHLGALPLGLDW